MAYIHVKHWKKKNPVYYTLHGYGTVNSCPNILCFYGKIFSGKHFESIIPNRYCYQKYLLIFTLNYFTREQKIKLYQKYALVIH